MGYLEEYDKRTINIKNPFKRFIFNILDKKYKNKGHHSRKAIYLNRILKISNLEDKKNLNILEIGGSDGSFLSSYNIAGEKTIIDIDDFYKESILGHGIKFYNRNIEKEGFVEISDSSIDLIIMNHVIEHISNYHQLLNESRRILKNNGIMYIKTPNILKFGFAFYNDFTHCKPYTPQSLKLLFNAYSFEEIITISSDNTSILIEDLFNLKFGRLSYKTKEIESVFIKIIN